jgi:hypothetical protein
MRKLLPSVSAFVALYILLSPSTVQSQPPGIAPPGGKGPDPIATLVTTACTGCHSIDRINNKKGDNAAWTTTVTRMRGLGANLTDEQVPLVVEYLTRNAGTIVVADGGAKGKGGPPGGGAAKGKGGGGGKNIQVLQGADIPATMQSFVQALGVLDKGACAYCHVEDRSADTKIQKVTARRMVIMMRAINGTFGDGKQHVTCYTCHRGSTTPLTTEP